MRTLLRILVVPILAIALVAGCGGDDDDDSVAQSGDAATTTSAPPETTTTVDTASPAAVDVIAADFSFDTSGVTEVPAGVVRVNLVNEGTEEHQATLLRFNDNVTIAQFGAAAAGDPTGAAALGLTQAFGGPNGVGPGAEVSTTAVLDEGDYVMICFIPSPSDGVSHAAKGMITPFTVTEAESDDAELAEGDGTIVARDFTWDEPDDFSGQGTFTFANEGVQPHEAAIYTIADGKTIADVGAFFSPTAPPGPPPFSAAGGIASVSSGVSTTVDLDLDPGEYAFICFVPDTAGSGAPHFTLGMLKGVTVS